MKIALTATLISALAATTAISGNIESPSIVDVAPVAATNDWGGLYVGALLSLGTAEYAYDSGNSSYGYDLEGQSFGGFAGYNIQNGAFVFGGEVAYSIGSVYNPNNDAYNFDNFIDLKARAGYSLGSALVYGFAGYSSATWQNFNTDSTASGMNYGAGVDLMVSDKMFVGVEYMLRDLAGGFENGNGISGDISTFSIRTGVNF